MKMKLTRRSIGIMAAGVLLLATATPSFALFGFDIVFDPSSYGELVTQYATQYKSYLQILTQTQTALNQFKTIEANLKSFSFKQLWQTQLNSLKQLTVGNQFGETNGMTVALNTNNLATATSAWTNANVAVNSDTRPYLAGQTPGSSDRLAQLSMIELSDATAPDCINAVGAYRAARTTGATATASLEREQLDTNADTNSEVEQLNLLNAAEAQKMNEMQAQGALHACLAEQTAIQNMQQRDANALDLNTAAFMQQQQAANPTYASNESNTWQSYLP
jgi:hypothetical protein